jgi:hypothetical protein
VLRPRVHPRVIFGHLTFHLPGGVQGTDRTAECLNIFLEFVPGGSLADLIKKFGAFLTAAPPAASPPSS